MVELGAIADNAALLIAIYKVRFVKNLENHHASGHNGPARYAPVAMLYYYVDKYGLASDDLCQA